MLRTLAAAAVALLALLLGGCTMETPSRLEEYKTEAEALADDVLAMIPEGLIESTLDPRSGPRFGDTLQAGQRPNDPAWWEVQAFAHLVDEQDASADAAAAISEGMAADGWTEERVREIDDGTRITDGFRKEIDGEDWYIEVTWVVTQPEMAETIMITVVSPPTTRGDNTESN